MKVITVRQPLAAAIFTEAGPRRIDSRRITTTYRGSLAIVAGLSPFMTEVYRLERLAGRSQVEPRHDVILGVVQLVDVHRSALCDPDVCAPRPEVAEIVEGNGIPLYHWVVADPQPVPAGKTFPYRGFFGLGVMTKAHAAALERAVGS